MRKHPIPLLAGLGATMFAAGLGWVALHGYQVRRNAPPGWIVDFSNPPAAEILGWAGMFLVVLALLILCVQLAIRLLRRLTSK
ncbi:MAG: hypothetical protein ABSE93_00900 [Terriglobia bacterium]|jgi:hypothetical protein